MTQGKQSPSAITHRMLINQAKEIAQLSSNVSIALNEITEIKHYLHSDAKTNTMGTVERSQSNEGRIMKIEQREKIYVAKAGMIYAFGTSVGGVLIYLFTRLFVR